MFKIRSLNQKLSVEKKAKLFQIEIYWYYTDSTDR